MATKAQLEAEIARLRAQVASGAVTTTATMSEVRAQHQAPCGRGFTSDDKVAEHVAYWKGNADKARRCAAGNVTKGHGPRKGEA